MQYVIIKSLGVQELITEVKNHSDDIKSTEDTKDTFVELTEVCVYVFMLCVLCVYCV